MDVSDGRKIDLVQPWWTPFVAHASGCRSCATVDVDRSSTLGGACYAGAGLLRDALHATAMSDLKELEQYAERHGRR